MLSDKVIFIQVLVLGALSGFIIGFGVAGLVLVDVVAQHTTIESTSDSRGLQCVICNSTEPLQQTAPMQETAPVQKTQSASSLYRLSEGVEMLPLEMLRDGTL